MELARKLGVRFVALGEPEYPPALRASDEAPPPILALRGREEALATTGRRRRRLAQRLRRRPRLRRPAGARPGSGGLRRRLGARARHRFAGAPGRRWRPAPIGVLAGGHARIYPPEAVPIVPRIAEHGAVVSEMPIEWEPRGRDFPRRNRIVSGLSLGVVVVEAARGSGSLITAQIRCWSRTAKCSPCRARRSIRARRAPTTCCARARNLRARRRRARVLDPVRAQDPFADFREDSARRQRAAMGRIAAARRRSRNGAARKARAGVRRGAGRAVRPQRGAMRWLRSNGCSGPSPITLDELASVAGLQLGKCAWR